MPPPSSVGHQPGASASSAAATAPPTASVSRATSSPIAASASSPAIRTPISHSHGAAGPVNASGTVARTGSGFHDG